MRTAILAVLLLALAACASSADVVAGTPTPDASPGPSAQDSLTGVLGGDPDLEGGCVWLDTDDGRVEVVWPSGYTATVDPVELRDGDDTVVAVEGESVRITGAQATDGVSTCQVGRIWTATTVERG